MEFFKEKLDDEFIKDITPIICIQNEETGYLKNIPLSPDWDTYKKLQDIGILKIFTIRENGELIGYSVFILGPNLYFKNSFHAKEEIFFISPDKRGLSLVIKFLKYVNNELKALGVEAVYHQVRPSRDYGKLLERLGYEKLTEIYGKEI